MMDKVQVGGITYSIVVQEYFKTPDDDRNLWGYCDYEKNEIYIRASLSEQRRQQVLIHELTHAIFHEAGYNEQDEDMINRISLILHQVIKNNVISF